MWVTSFTPRSDRPNGKHIFHALGRCIRRSRERAERRRIDKGSAVEAADIQTDGIALDDIAGRLRNIAGKPQARREIIGASRRNVSDRKAMTALKHSGNDFIESSVSPGANDAVILRGIPREFARRIPTRLVS